MKCEQHFPSKNTNTYTMVSLPQLLILLGILLFVLTYSYNSIRNNTRKGDRLLAPEPSGAFPIIGHLHLLQSKAPVARILGKIADDYGPVYSLRLGFRRALVVSNWQMVKECFGTNDKIFVSRPDTAVSRYMVYDHAGFALAPYGPLWREIRKLVTSKILTSQRLEQFKNIRNSELKDSINELSIMSTENKVVEMNKWFENITSKISLRMLIGNNEDLQLEEAIKKGLYLTGVFVLSDVIPYLEWMDIGGHLKAMKQLAQDLDSVISKWLDEHVEKRKEYNGDKEADLMDVMLSTLPKDAEMFGHGRETIIKATALVSCDLVLLSLYEENCVF